MTATTTRTSNGKGPEQMPATKKLVAAPPPATGFRVTWGDVVWYEDADDITAAENYAIAMLVGSGWDSFDVANSYPALLALVTILHARDTGLSIGEAWIDLGPRPRGEILAALSRGE